MARKSLVVPTVFTLVGLILLLGLGTWQIERLHWKEGLIAARKASFRAPPVALPQTLAQAQPLAFHHVVADGRLLNAHAFYVYTMSKRGKPGYDVVTPLQMGEGAVVFVNRGFVPTDRRLPASRPGSDPDGTVRITGILRLPSTDGRGLFAPDNHPARNDWYYIDPAAMAAAAGLHRVLPFYVDADAGTTPGAWPQGGQTPIGLPNNHLQYAIIWYGLAVTLLVQYIALVHRHRTQT